MADAETLEKLCFVDGKPLQANAAQRELFSLCVQAKKIMVRGMDIAPPNWLKVAACVICTPGCEEALWPLLAEMVDHEGFHCADPEHVARFHGVAPQTGNCCELSYDPDRPYAWRKSFLEEVDATKPSRTLFTFVMH